MPPHARAPRPDPLSAMDAGEFRAVLHELRQWAGLTSLQQLEAAAKRRGTSMPVSTANRALNAEKLPTAEFVQRFVLACGGDEQVWARARDALADARYARVVTARPRVVVPVAREVCPYPGLTSFGPGESRWFFGRDRIIADLLGLLAERRAGTGPLTVFGPSGSGKSSVLGAGLSAALDEGRLAGHPDVRQALFTPTADPMRALCTQLGELTSRDPDEIAASLAGNPARIVDHLREVPQSVVVVVDQFEEVFTLSADEQRREAFIAALSAASTSADGPPPALVVLGLRADFLGRCADYPLLAQASRYGQILLGAMDESELRAAIEGPAAAEGLELGPGLVDVLVRDLSEGSDGARSYRPGALPLLAHALRATWQQRDGRRLTIQGYRLVGGITGSVARTAEHAYQQLDADRQDIARAALLRMVHLGEGTGDTRRQVHQAQLVEELTDAESVRTVLDVLIQARLLTTDGEKVEIVHEALLAAWPRLRDWIESDRAGLVLEQRLIAAAQAWDREGRHDADLYRGPRLAAARERVELARPLLPAVAVEFRDASVRREQEQTTTAARRDRRLRRLVVALAGLLVLAVGATVLAVVAQYDLRRQADVGVSRKLADTVDALRITDPPLAARLAVAAYRISSTAEAQGAVLSSLVRIEGTRRTNSDTGGARRDVAFSASGDLLAAGGEDGNVQVWRMGPTASLADTPVVTLTVPGQARSVAFDDRNRFLAVYGEDGMTRLYTVADLATGVSRSWASLPAVGQPLAFTRDGSVLATGGTTHDSIRLWDLTGPQPRMRGEALGHRQEVLAADFDNGRTLATASLDGTVRFWDARNLDSPTQLAQRQPSESFAHAVAFSPDGRILASGNDDNSVKLWNVEDRENPKLLIESLVEHRAAVTDVAFSPDGRSLVTASLDNTALLWDVSVPAAPVVRAGPLGGENDNINAAVFAPDGHTLAIASQSVTLGLWETDVNRAVDAICAMSLPAFTEADWHRYLPERSFEQPCPGAPPPPARAERVKLAPGLTELIATHSGKCVVVKGGVAAAETPTYQTGCNGAAETTWMLRPTTAAKPEVGPYQVVNVASKMCLESADADQIVGGASRATQRPCQREPGPGQLWSFERHGEEGGRSLGRFRNTRKGDCLDVNKGSTYDDAAVVRWPCGGQANQTFAVEAQALAR